MTFDLLFGLFRFHRNRKYVLSCHRCTSHLPTLQLKGLHARHGLCCECVDILFSGSPAEVACNKWSTETVLYCAVLCCAVLCCAVLCCAVLCYVMKCTYYTVSDISS